MHSYEYYLFFGFHSIFAKPNVKIWIKIAVLKGLYLELPIKIMKSFESYVVRNLTPDNIDYDMQWPFSLTSKTRVPSFVLTQIKEFSCSALMLMCPLMLTDSRIITAAIQIKHVLVKYYNQKALLETKSVWRSSKRNVEISENEKNAKLTLLDRICGDRRIFLA